MLLSIGKAPRATTAGRCFHARSYRAVAASSELWVPWIPEMFVIVTTVDTPFAGWSWLRTGW